MLNSVSICKKMLANRTGKARVECTGQLPVQLEETTAGSRMRDDL